ncbi:MAG: CPBP family intramembrane metalloprotease [bacterium]|nr:CPBP family intramembrane metalloprotease [bacterium]
MVRALLALTLAVVTALAVDELTVRRGLDPPGFRSSVRRVAAMLVLAAVFLFGIFTPLVTFDLPPEVDLESLSYAQLFLFQALLVASLATWYALGYLGVVDRGAVKAVTPWWVCFGLRARRLRVELGVGLVAGVGVWMVTLAGAMLWTLILSWIGGEELVDSAGEAPELIVFMAGLPVVVRLLISLSAGVVEELFFRGFLQPRIGIALTTLLFVGAHLGYGQPLMLFGLTVLSLLYGGLVKWRGGIWAAIAAHTLFDAVQLLVVIPAALDLMVEGG